MLVTYMVMCVNHLYNKGTSMIQTFLVGRSLIFVSLALSMPLIF